jgi:hypothetical protein
MSSFWPAIANSSRREPPLFCIVSITAQDRLHRIAPSLRQGSAPARPPNVLVHLHYLIDDPEPAAGETLVLSYSPNWPFPSQQATVGQQMIGGDRHQQKMQQAYGRDIEPIKLLCVEQPKQQDREQV